MKYASPPQKKKRGICFFYLLFPWKIVKYKIQKNYKSLVFLDFCPWKVFKFYKSLVFKKTSDLESRQVQNKKKLQIARFFGFLPLESL